MKGCNNVTPEKHIQRNRESAFSDLKNLLNSELKIIGPLDLNVFLCLHTPTTSFSSE